jgi:mRNA guanylyltransferase
MPMHTPIPEIPGNEADPHTARNLAERVSQLCHLNSSRFPGSQPVSFTSASLDMLERMDFWVCEKSDGVRLLIFVVMNGMTGEQEVWLVSTVKSER